MQVDLHHSLAFDDIPTETAEALEPIPGLTLGHVLAGVGADKNPPIRLEEIHLIRHAFQPGKPEALQGPEDLTPVRVLDYTRSQSISTRRFPADPARYWVILIADGQRRSRLFATFENHGEVLVERTDTNRYFDLHPSNFLAPLVSRLVVDWVSPGTGIGAPPAPRTCRCWRSPTGTRFPSRDSTPCSSATTSCARWWTTAATPTGGWRCHTCRASTSSLTP
ncbi:hypothetical protein ACW0JT_20415 [Arthrobacter sp. SA17]